MRSKSNCWESIQQKIMMNNERRCKMIEERFEKASIIIHFDEKGYIESATNLDGSPLVYDDNEKKRIHNSKTRLVTPNDCCWRLVNGAFRCRPEYCL